SLDLRDGDPVVASGGIPPGEPAHVVAAHAANAGAGAVIVIDLARVGTRAGLDLGLIGRARPGARCWPAVAFAGWSTCRGWPMPAVTAHSSRRRCTTAGSGLPTWRQRSG